VTADGVARQTPTVTAIPGGVGIWSGWLRYGDPPAAAEAAAELESLGYTALWLPDVGGDLFGALGNVLAPTDGITIATGIMNLWMHPAVDAGAAYASLVADHGDRLLMGIGVSHGAFIDHVRPGSYTRPLAHTAEYLDALDAADPTIPRDRRLLAALGPKMLELARTRTAGTHPYNVWPEHTAAARAALGPGGLVMPEQALVLETDPSRAREIARGFLATYLQLPNYANNWFRFGFTPDDAADGGTDALVDALVAWGDVGALVARVQEHFDAGADHVCVQVLTDEALAGPTAEWRELAPALTALRG
jgi:probable F420-dependent oxidoreductase